MVTQSQAIESLITKLEPDLRDAFRAAMQELRDGVDMRALITALEANDIEAAIRALNIERAAFNEYLAAKSQGYSAAGIASSVFVIRQLNAALSAIPGTPESPIQFRFDMSNPRAEDWIRTQAGERITGYVQEQVDAAREVIGRGYARGEGPQTIATDLAGRINRATGRREGGILGLNRPQAEFAQTVHDRLRDGDIRGLFIRDRETGELRPRYTRMDGRDIRTLRSRLASGKPLTKAEQERIAQRYADSLLARRAEDVARTETGQAVMAARKESYRQALDKAGMSHDSIIKTWNHNGGSIDARLTHLAMNGESVTGLDTPFVLGDGSVMQYALDPNGGADNNVNCRCDTTYRIDFAQGVI